MFEITISVFSLIAVIAGLVALYLAGRAERTKKEIKR